MSAVTSTRWGCVRARPKTLRESVGNFVFVSHTMKPVRAGGGYGGEQGRKDRGCGAGPTSGGTRSGDGVRNRRSGRRAEEAASGADAQRRDGPSSRYGGGGRSWQSPQWL